jgi:hypothetical protein
MAEDGAAMGETPPAGPVEVKNPQDQFMDVVDKAQASIPPEKYAKKALIFLDRDSQPRKFCIALVERPDFDRIVMLLIILNTIWMTVRARTPRSIATIAVTRAERVHFWVLRSSSRIPS